MWRDSDPQGYEVRKCRNRVAQFLHGTVLDFGCGDEKVIPQAIGIDLNPAADLQLDLSNPASFRFFGDGAADVVFSSHFLEHAHDYEMVLGEWWRILKPGGLLILYLPHRDMYPRIGHYGANPDHKHDFAPDDILNALSKIARFEVVRNETHDEGMEYSFELIVKKVPTGEMHPTERDNRDSVLVIRYGAIGDMIIVTPLLRALKESGERVVVLTIPESATVLLNNPNVDDVMVVQRGAMKPTHLHEYHAELEKRFKRVINLCESVERTLLFEPRDEIFFASHEERHRVANVNYYDRTLELGGFRARGMRPEIHLSDYERNLGRAFAEKNSGIFTIQWQLTGSSVHKVYPWAEYVIEELLKRYRDIKIYLSGGSEASVISDWNDKRVVSKLGIWGIRQSITMPAFVNLVVSPETSVLNASGAFDTPKIGLLTHSSIENLTKHFVNDYSLESLAPCAPCHRLVHDTAHCTVDSKYGLPICMASGHPIDRVFKQIQGVYRRWKRASDEERQKGARKDEGNLWRAEGRGGVLRHDQRPEARLQ